MTLKKLLANIGILLALSLTTPGYADIGRDGLGQTIQIYTRLHDFIGNPTLLIIIRDLDHNQTVPYLFDITRGDNFWLLFTYGNHYLITAATLKTNTYQTRYNDYHVYEINNVCHLESNGRIIRGESLYITIGGAITKHPDSLTCHVSRFTDPNFTVSHANDL